jgi:hypothetical protein
VSHQKESADRFIPRRNCDDANQLFNLPEKDLAIPNDVSDFNEKEQNSLIYESLLEQR